MSDEAVLSRYEITVQNLWTVRMSQMNAALWFAGAVYLFAPLVFGAPVWKSLVIGFLAIWAIFIKFARHQLMRVAPILFMLTLLEFSGALPPMAQWPAQLAAIVKGASG
jgi:hypothetical protein